MLYKMLLFLLLIERIWSFPLDFPDRMTNSDPYYDKENNVQLTTDAIGLAWFYRNGYPPEYDSKHKSMPSVKSPISDNPYFTKKENDYDSEMTSFVDDVNLQEYENRLEEKKTDGGRKNRDFDYELMHSNEAGERKISLSFFKRTTTIPPLSYEKIQEILEKLFNQRRTESTTTTINNFTTVDNSINNTELTNSFNSTTVLPTISTTSTLTTLPASQAMSPQNLMTIVLITLALTIVTLICGKVCRHFFKLRFHRQWYSKKENSETEHLLPSSCSDDEKNGTLEIIDISDYASDMTEIPERQKSTVETKSPKDESTLDEDVVNANTIGEDYQSVKIDHYPFQQDSTCFYDKKKKVLVFNVKENRDLYLHSGTDSLVSVLEEMDENGSLLSDDILDREIDRNDVGERTTTDFIKK